MSAWITYETLMTRLKPHFDHTIRCIYLDVDFFKSDKCQYPTKLFNYIYPQRNRPESVRCRRWKMRATKTRTENSNSKTRKKYRDILL